MVASLKITEKFELKLLKVDLVEIFLKIFLNNFSIILSAATPEVYRYVQWRSVLCGRNAAPPNCN